MCDSNAKKTVTCVVIFSIVRIQLKKIRLVIFDAQFCVTVSREKLLLLKE